MSALWLVALVVLLKIAFYWLNAAAYRSMAKMKAINPKVMEMRERLKDKPQQMQQEMMRIYREEKVNPLGGCLPMFLQIPVFIGLYRALGVSFELRQAPFALWIHDLSLPDRLLRGERVVVLGAEGRGLRPGVLSAVDHRVRIPLAGRVASLNVASAAASIVWGSARSGSPMKRAASAKVKPDGPFSPMRSRAAATSASRRLPW